MCPRRRMIFFEPALAHFERCVWRPAVDVKRAPYGWLVKAELPGVALDQVQISIRGNSLLLSGVRRDTLPAEGDTYYAMEIAYCRFERRIDFPAPIEGAEVTLASHNGLLLVRLVLSSEPSAPADHVLRS